MVNSNQAAAGSTLGGATVPALRLSSTAAINKVSLSKPSTSATATPRVRFQLDNHASSEFPSGAENSQPSADVRSTPCATAIPVPSDLAGNEGATSDVGLSQSLCEVHSKTDVPSNGQQEVGKGFLPKLTLAADDVAGTSMMSRGTPNPGSLDADNTNSAKVSMSVTEAGGACAAQPGHALCQEHSAGQVECARYPSEHDCIAPMIDSIRRRIKVAEFQFAYAGYSARLALKHSA